MCTLLHILISCQPKHRSKSYREVEDSQTTSFVNGNDKQHTDHDIVQSSRELKKKNGGKNTNNNPQVQGKASKHRKRGKAGKAVSSKSGKKKKAKKNLFSRKGSGDTKPIPSPTLPPVTSSRPTLAPTTSLAPTPYPWATLAETPEPSPIPVTPWPTNPPLPGPVNPPVTCPPSSVVGCTAVDPYNPMDECSKVGQSCDGEPEKVCCRDACPRNYCATDYVSSNPPSSGSTPVGTNKTMSPTISPGQSSF